MSESFWKPPTEPPKSGKPILIWLKDGEVHEGHYIKNANKYVKNVNRYRIYKTGKTVGMDEVNGWKNMPIIGYEIKRTNR